MQLKLQCCEGVGDPCSILRTLATVILAIAVDKQTHYTLRNDDGPP